MSTERAIQDRFVKALKDAGIYYVKIISASTSGHPDCIASVKGKFVSFEFKSDTGRVSPLQKYRHDQIRQSGGIVFVVNSKNIETVIELIRRLYADNPRPAHGQMRRGAGHV